MISCVNAQEIALEDLQMVAVDIATAQNERGLDGLRLQLSSLGLRRQRALYEIVCVLSLNVLYEVL